MDSHQKKLDLIKRLAYYLDSAFPIPGTKYRVGLDPIIGLIPGVGDAVATLMSTYLVVLAIDLKVSRWTIIRMVINIMIESVIGSLPVLGDIFDAVWKANERNHALLEAAMQNPQGRAVDKWFAFAIALALISIFVLTLALTFWILQWLISMF